MQSKAAPELDPGAKLAVSGGGKLSGFVAVELFAVAPERSKRRESSSIGKIARSAFPGSSTDPRTPEPRSNSERAIDSG